MESSTRSSAQAVRGRERGALQCSVPSGAHRENKKSASKQWNCNETKEVTEIFVCISTIRTSTVEETTMAQLPNNYYGWVSLGDMTAAAATAPNEWSTEMIIQGVISLTKGENPRILEQKMLAFMPPKERKSSF